MLELAKSHPDRSPGMSPVPSPYRLWQWDATRVRANTEGGFLPVENQVWQQCGQPVTAKHGKPTPLPPGTNQSCHILLTSPFPFLSLLVLSLGSFQQQSKAQPLPPEGPDAGAGTAALLCTPAPPESSSPSPPLSYTLMLPCRGTRVLRGC